MPNLHIRYATLVAIPIFLFYITYFHLDSIVDQGRVVSNHLTTLTGYDHVEAEGLALEEALHAWMIHSLEDSDFAGKADRVNALASLIEIVKEHPTTKLRNSLETIFDIDYPWCYREPDEYVPWGARYKDKTSDVGIVICAEADDIPFVVHLIRTLREVLGSDLPIEIAFAGNEKLSPDHQKIVKALGSEIYSLDLMSHFNDTTIQLSNHKYALGPFAILASRFRQVIAIEADVVLLRKPEELLSLHQSYAATGVLFYHDRAFKSDRSRHEWIESKLHFRNLSTSLTSSLFWQEDLWQEMSSGVVAVDKDRPEAFMTIMFAAWMNLMKIREQETHENVLEDKATYWLAADFARLPYEFVPYYASIIGNAQTDQQKICSSHALHMGKDGEDPIWFGGGVVRNAVASGREDMLVVPEFTHFMTARSQMEDMPQWTDVEKGIFCAEGKDIIDVPKAGLGIIMDEILQIGKEVFGEGK